MALITHFTVNPFLFPQTDILLAEQWPVMCDVIVNTMP